MKFLRTHFLTFIAFYQCIGYTAGVGILKEGLIFIKREFIKVTDIEVLSVVKIGTIDVGYTSVITDLCHGHKHILLYWTDPTLKLYGRIAIDKSQAVIVDQRILMAGEEVIHVKVSPDNRILFLDKGSELTMIDMKKQTESLICFLSDKQLLFEMFYDYRKSLLYFLEGQVNSSVILKFYDVKSKTISNAWSTSEIYAVHKLAYDSLKGKFYIIYFDILWVFRTGSTNFVKLKMEQSLYSLTVIPDILFMTTEVEGKLLKLHTDQYDDDLPEVMSAASLKREIPHGDLFSFSSLNFHPNMFGDDMKDLEEEHKPIALSKATSFVYSAHLLVILFHVL